MKDGFPFDGAAPLGLRGKTEDTHFKPKLKLKLERQLELDFFIRGRRQRAQPFRVRRPRRAGRRAGARGGAGIKKVLSLRVSGARGLRGDWC